MYETFHAFFLSACHRLITAATASSSAFSVVTFPEAGTQVTDDFECSVT
jgi:hypothetical protein